MGVNRGKKDELPQPKPRPLPQDERLSQQVKKHDNQLPDDRGRQFTEKNDHWHKNQPKPGDKKEP